ncbi:hypothetical protein BH09ACT7_BH09ACT7_27720 [soil metagenome]
MSDYCRSQMQYPSPCQAGTRDTSGRLRVLSQRYQAALDAARDVSLHIERELRSAVDAGCPLTALSEASGLSVSQLEYILVSVDVQRRLSGS